MPGTGSAPESGRQPGCRTCELVTCRDKREAPLWDDIHRTPHWDVVHNYETTLPGWLVLTTRRHIASLAELSVGESTELGPLIQQTSVALKAAVGCAKTYVIQLAEHPLHQHVHFHVIPRMHDIPADRMGMNVFNYSPAKNNQNSLTGMQMNEIAQKVRGALSDQ